MKRTAISRSVVAALLLAAALSGFAGSASAQSCPANIPHLTGTWEVLPYRMPISPISVNLMPNGKVLIVAGSENTATNNVPGSQSFRAAVWDPNGSGASSIVAQNVTYDIFCSHVTQLPDGRSLVVGGTSDYTFTGESRSSIFDWQSNAFAQSQSMTVGRWYGSAVTLGDGRVVAMSGLTTTGATTRRVEIYDLTSGGLGWTTSTDFPVTPPLYPRLVLLPNGNVYYTGQGSGGSTAFAGFFNPTNGTWTTSVAPTANRSYGGATLLPLVPPSYKPKVMNFGGGSGTGLLSTEIIDLSVANPATATWAPGPSMSVGRIQMNVVLLPNGTVLAEGGSGTDETPDVGGRNAQLYNPATNTMGSAGTTLFSRLYHSTTVLLPDARVAVMGSNPGGRGSYESTIEIYTPPYLFDTNDQLITANRPAITAMTPSSGVLNYNSTFSVSFSANPATIKSAVLMRLGSSTHAYTMDQRFIELCGSAPQEPPCTVNNSALTLTTPPNGNVAPPGYYMLFLLDNAGVPSIAQFVQLTPYSTVPPTASITSTPPPGTNNNVTIQAGGVVSFGTPSTPSKYSWVFSGGSPATSTLQNPGNVTFTSAGVYTVSLTAIDASGNSDPHPPTRTITVLPNTPDFTITVGAASSEAVPGASATFPITVTGKSGFTGAVSLTVASESGFPAGISSQGFSPPTINGSGSSTLTMATTAISVPYALSLTITGTSGTIKHTASTTLVVKPPTPSSLSATPGASQVSLTWPAATGASTYEVKRAGVSGGPYITRACTASTSYVDTGLTNGNSYFYTISGMYTGTPTGTGESPVSTEASATPTGGTTGGSLTGLGAVSANAVNLTTTGTLDWAKWPNYIHKASGGSQIPTFIKIGAPSVQTYNNDARPISWSDGTPTAAGTNDLGGNFISGVGNGFQVSAPADTTTRTIYVYVGGWNSGGRLQAHLSDSSAGDYIDTSLSSGTQYDAVYTLTYRAASAGKQLIVQWTQASGTGNVTLQAAALAGAQGAPPPVPTGVNASDGTSATNVTVTWSASSGATSYTVYRSIASGTQGTSVGTSNTTSLTDTTPTPGTLYFYSVTATGPGGTSAASQQNSGYAGTLPAPPPVPTGVNASDGTSATAVTVTWTVSSGATSYTIYRSMASGTQGASVGTSTTASFADSTVTPGTLYFYSVTASSSGGTSVASSQDSGYAGTLPAGGSLFGSGVANNTAVNLTTVGTSDWAKWPNYIHKASGGSKIPTFVKIGAATLNSYANDPRPISWTDGTPTASATNDLSGNYTSGIGNGFQITAPADTTTRTLLVYVGGWSSGGRLVAHLSDGSAADFVNTAFSSATGQYAVIYTLTYRAGSAGKQLTVLWTQASGTGNVTIRAAALQ